MFIDRAKVTVRSGTGGKGAQSFYRDKYQREGVPDGGDGGRGADIIIRADHNLLTLLDFQFHRHFFGAHGGHGSGNHKKGRGAEDIIVRVPLGTTIKDPITGSILRDLDKDADQVIIAKGGKGGLGNKHRREATLGEPGEEKIILLDLKLIADVGIVGFPNAGKSTLISSISNAHPKVAAYPFTTTAPILGVARSGDKRFVVADIPGLIEGASEGRGLGDQFLKHIERTKILIHLIDMAGFEGRDPLDDYKKINLELKNYSKDVFKKPQVVCANKMDLDGAKENLKRFKKLTKKTVYPISALNKQGLEELVDAIAKKYKVTQSFSNAILSRRREYKRVVVKIGSSLFATEKNKLDTGLVNKLAKQISCLIKQGKEVVVVSSGAIALGMSILKLNTRPKRLEYLQAAAAIGQHELMHVYKLALNKYKLNCAQLLLTWDDFLGLRYTNAKHTLNTLLKLNCVPIINENDTVATEEIKFGDNDRLSALVSILVGADLLIILSDVEGLLDKNKKVMRQVDKITGEIKSLASPTNKNTCVGGMVTKIEAARIAVEGGVPCVIANGRKEKIISQLTNNPYAQGTIFMPLKK